MQSYIYYHVADLIICACVHVFAISYSHKYELLNFKITKDPNTREVCVASKKFGNFHELLEFYKFNPLKIRSRPNDNILLTFPLPVDKNLENIHKKAQDELYSELAGM